MIYLMIGWKRKRQIDGEQQVVAGNLIARLEDKGWLETDEGRGLGGIFTLDWTMIDG